MHTTSSHLPYTPLFRSFVIHDESRAGRVCAARALTARAAEQKEHAMTVSPPSPEAATSPASASPVGSVDKALVLLDILEIGRAWSRGRGQMGWTSDDHH